MVIDRERRFVYSYRNISFADIVEFAYRSVNPKHSSHTKAAVQLISQLINDGKIPIEKAAKIAGYDYSNASDKYWFRNSFFNPLFNAGLLVEEQEIKEGRIVKTFINFDASFLKLMDNFKTKWLQSALKYKK